MLDVKDFSFFENQNTFDFKGFLIKTGSYWKWFILGLVVSLTIAHQVNIRKQKIYSLDTTIAVIEQDNPLFTNNTSLVFNWGGSSDQVQNIASTLKSRSHNELVVESLDFYVDYLKEQKYFIEDIYGKSPFKVELDKSKNQLLNVPIKIKFTSPNEFILQIKSNSNTTSVINYSTLETNTVDIGTSEINLKFRLNQPINLPFLNFKIIPNNKIHNEIGQEYIIKFNSFDNTVVKYQKIKVTIDEKATSILKLSLDGTNKARIVDYLNTTVKTLIDNQLKNKNLFADNTIKFIDETLASMEAELKNANNDLKDFSRNKNIVEINDAGQSIYKELKDLDFQNDLINRKLNYYNSLSSYLKNSKDYSKLPAPTVAGIEDPNIIQNVSDLISLSVSRSEMDRSIKSGTIFYDETDNKINSLKKVLLENINAAKSAVQFESNQIKTNLSNAESKLRTLPENQQLYSNIMRKYDLSSSIYETYLQKKSEASIVKAANLADIQFIDPAKDIGIGLIGPRTGVNYVMGIFIGLLVPLLVVFFLFFINNAVQNTEDISKQTQIPLIGVVGLKHTDTNLAVFEKPKSALSESFRAIRSSLQFLYKKQKVDGPKVLMLTSTVSGEGKTFCSLNIATVFALSEKKTVILGLDLRKPKIFDDFNITNEIGAVNYLIGSSTLDEIIFTTHIPFLDVITSGPVPPNPAELIMGDSMEQLINELKKRYDYIILDTPPVGLVTDAVELSQFADLTLYVMRQNFTKKEMINLLNIRVGRDELQNVSIILNGFENKAKYGAGYGYGYGYGYGAYSNGYHEDDESKYYIVRLFKKYYYKLVKKI
jgi:capsular exopolysaccharide synthesis family protein